MDSLVWFVAEACQLAGISESAWRDLPPEEKRQLILQWQTHTGTTLDFVAKANIPAWAQREAEKMKTPKPDNLLYDEFSKFDIRAGTITHAEPVPKSNKLLKLEVNFGPEVGHRTILAGIAGSYQADVITGTRVIAVLNLAPRTMFGIVSHGMLLAGHTEDGNIALINAQVPDGVSIG